MYNEQCWVFCMLNYGPNPNPSCHLSARKIKSIHLELCTRTNHSHFEIRLSQQSALPTEQQYSLYCWYCAKIANPGILRAFTSHHLHLLLIATFTPALILRITDSFYGLGDSKEILQPETLSTIRVTSVIREYTPAASNQHRSHTSAPSIHRLMTAK